MTYDFLVYYLNIDGQRCSYGGPGHMIQASSSEQAIEKVKASMPPQVAKTWTRLEVGLRRN